MVLTSQSSKPREDSSTQGTSAGLAGHQDDMEDSNSSRPPQTSHEDADEDDDSTVVLAKRENNAVWCLKGFFLFLLCAVALAVCLSVYFVTERSEKDDFEQDFTDLAVKIVDTIQLSLTQRMGILEHFSMDLTTIVSHNNDTMQWPFMMIRPSDYLHLSQSAAVLTDTFAVTMVPLVASHEFNDWLDHVSKHDGWRAEMIAAQKNVSLQEAQAQTEPIPPVILNAGPDGLSPVTDAESSPYFLPIWHSYPISNYVPMGMNLYQHPHYSSAMKLMLEEKRPVFTPSYDFVDPVKAAKDPRRDMIYGFLEYYESIEYDDDPVMPLCYPIFEDLNRRTKVVGAVVWGVYWKTYFRRILPEGANGIVVVLENDCGQLYTYQIDGNDARFLNHGDTHDRQYDYLEVGGPLQSMLLLESNQQQSATTNSNGECLYHVRVYPSQQYEESQIANKSLMFVIALAAVFFFTCVSFVLYDFCVERRQRAVSDLAKRSGALVSSLFPAAVRDQLYEECEAQRKSKKKETASSGGISFDDDDWQVNEREKHNDAIASVYENCTILFADLAGFTRWSATRSPSEVFLLLETLYAAFDKLAERRRVFKVETIGDCYLAATGLPTPQASHHLIAVRFASECMSKMRDLVHTELVGKLGEDTAGLAMRIGLHSGSVTAGVLRGAKSRFQIFGDTVNTASRMESTGQADKIQVSESTAKLLADSGKGHWLKPRTDVVAVKGKGDMSTYWADPQIQGSFAASITSTYSSCGGDYSARIDMDDDAIDLMEEAAPESHPDNNIDATMSRPPVAIMSETTGSRVASNEQGEVEDKLRKYLNKSSRPSDSARLEL